MRLTAVLSLFILWDFNLLQAQDFSVEELKILKKAKTGKLAVYHSRQDKEFIRLMNLARTEPELCAKYMSVKYEIADEQLQIITQFRPSKKTMPLRPKFGLHLSAWIHAVFSGWSGSTGHQAFELREYMFLNFNTILGESGENCEYGNKKAVGIFLSLMHSPPHRANILNSSYTRVGVSKKWHIKYRRNTVSVFSGPSSWDKLLKKNHPF